MFLKEPSFITIGTLLVLLTISEGKAQSSPAEIDSLYYHAFALGNSNLDSTLAIASDLVVLSREFRDEYGLVKAKILSSYVYFSRFKLDTARQLLDECELWFRDHPGLYHSQNRGRVQLYYSRLCARKQEYRLARVYGTEAVRIFRKINDAKYEGDALGHLGIIEFLIENYTASLAYYLEAMRVKYNSPDERERAAPDLLLNISLVYSRMGLYDEARNYARRSMNAVSSENRSSLSNILNSIGASHNLQNEYDSAIYYYEQSRKSAIENNTPALVFVAEYNIANVLSRAGDYRKSLDASRKALHSATVIPTGMREASEQLMASNYFHLKMYDSAILVARATLAKNLPRNNKISVIANADVLSNSFGSLKKPDSSLYYLKIKSAYKAGDQKKLSMLYAEMENIAKQKEIEILRRDTALSAIQNKILQLSIGFGAVLTPLAIGVLALYFRNRQKKEKLLHYQLRTELDQRKKDLHQQALRMIYINNGLAEIEDAVKKIKTDESDQVRELQDIFNGISVTHSLEQEWSTFYRYFGNVHVGFYEKFNTQYPHLTQLEKRLAGLVRMNLTNSEIAGLLSIETKSVKMAKYRLKKKLELTDEQDIYQFLQTFEHVNEVTV
jgi:DNA-binding CsgD family transcriptional regulator